MRVDDREHHIRIFLAHHNIHLPSKRRHDIRRLTAHPHRGAPPPRGACGGGGGYVRSNGGCIRSGVVGYGCGIRNNPHGMRSGYLVRSNGGRSSDNTNLGMKPDKRNGFKSKADTSNKFPSSYHSICEFNPAIDINNAYNLALNTNVRFRSPVDLNGGWRPAVYGYNGFPPPFVSSNGIQSPINVHDVFKPRTVANGLESENQRGSCKSPNTTNNHLKSSEKRNNESKSVNANKDFQSVPNSTIGFEQTNNKKRECKSTTNTRNEKKAPVNINNELKSSTNTNKNAKVESNGNKQSKSSVNTSNECRSPVNVSKVSKTPMNASNGYRSPLNLGNSCKSPANLTKGNSPPQKVSNGRKSPNMSRNSCKSPVNNTNKYASTASKSPVTVTPESISQLNSSSKYKSPTITNSELKSTVNASNEFIQVLNHHDGYNVPDGFYGAVAEENGVAVDRGEGDHAEHRVSAEEQAVKRTPPLGQRRPCPRPRTILATRGRTRSPPPAPRRRTEQHRPPVYNPEDYAASLRKWGRRGASGGVTQLYNLTPGGGAGGSLGAAAGAAAGVGADSVQPPPLTDARSKTLPPPKDRGRGGSSSSTGGGSSVVGSLDNVVNGLTPALSAPEMSLRQFATVSELLAKLRLDLRLAFPSFVQEFVREPLDGVTLLLELLRAVQLSQAAQSPAPAPACVAPGPAAHPQPPLAHAPQPARPPPPPVMRRALLDEHACLQCLRACLRCADAARRLAASHTGLFTLAVCIMSNVAKSRVIALELLTRACEAPGGGHGPVSEALSTLRLRFGEPVRFRFLVGMLTSAGVGAELQAAGLRFLNTFVATAPSPQLRLYLQAELEQAGFQAAAVRKVLPSTAAAAEQVRQELARWERGYVDVGVLRSRAEAAERDVAALRDKTALLERRVQILQEEKGILVSLERCLQERCTDLQRELAKQRAAVAVAGVVGGGMVPGQTTVPASGGGGGSAAGGGGGGSTPAEDEGISSSDQEHSLSASDSGGDVEREPMVYEMFDVHNDTILVEAKKGSVPQPPSAAVAAAAVAAVVSKKAGTAQTDDDDEETTIDEVIEELRNIINDAETEAYAQEAAERAAAAAQDKQISQLPKHASKPQPHRVPSSAARARPAVTHTPAAVHTPTDRSARFGKYSGSSVTVAPTAVAVTGNNVAASGGGGGGGGGERAIVPVRLLPQPPRRARSLVQLMYPGRRGYAEDGVNSGNPFFDDDDSPSHTSEDSDSLLSAARARGSLLGGGGGATEPTVCPTLLRPAKGPKGAAEKKAAVRRSESFHHTHIDRAMPAASRTRRADSKASESSARGGGGSGAGGGGGRRPLPRCGSFDGLFFVTEYGDASPDHTPKPQPRTSLQQTAQGHAVTQSALPQHHIKIQQTHAPPTQRRASQDSAAGRKLKSKSLDRIDEGLDSLVDIVLTDRGGVGGVGSRVAGSGVRRGGGGSSGRGSADDWSLEWSGERERRGSGSGGSAGCGPASSAASPPPGVVIVTRSPSALQPLSAYAAAAGRRPPDGARYPGPASAARTTPSAASGFDSPPGFVLRRGGHGNAGLYSGAGSRCSSSASSATGGGRRHHAPSHGASATRTAVSVASAASTARAASGSAVSAGGKLADLPSGLY